MERETPAFASISSGGIGMSELTRDSEDHPHFLGRTPTAGELSDGTWRDNTLQDPFYKQPGHVEVFMDNGRVYQVCARCWGSQSHRVKKWRPI